MKTERELNQELDTIRRGTVEIISEPELLEKIKSKPALTIKAGFDPTAPDLHLGHFVLLRKLKHFQDLGHEVCFMLGDFTAMIGDPTGKSETRKRLSKEEVLENSKTYQNQVFKILDPKKTKILYNSHWCSEMKFEDVLVLTSKYTVSRMLERDDFTKRHKAGTPISMIEFLYPLVQGYDSVAMKADVELGGTDQKFNMLVGRDLQREYGQKPQSVITLPLLVGLDGVKKMSKSLGNYVGVTEKPIDMYGKIMSISDDLMWNYFELLTDLPVSEMEKRKEGIRSKSLHPKEVKTELALLVMDQLHPEEENRKAVEEWTAIHNTKNRALPDEIPTETLDPSYFSEKPPLLVYVLSQLKFIPSVSEGRRLIQAGGLYLDEEKITDPGLTLEPGKEYLIRQGKKGKFLKIKT
ncbi:tyrosine--tRNA ligase [Leptospira bandrabouensis]|uniref:Tyrosine--tRNA ligase n=1 Tax=Leptospira bandrabouensis TaxID=2484903 RepID=A0A6H3NSQ8_9LEPT|nr:tyrosine--tRNA ligase [Leptospira bandrabouensis]MCG6145441.1 tyrosine--tRNA ligase [Leptospira bandrabouensis]MCG6152472.1 tyrosine--tRNA ligase [Leptospira bandrabouensis]MCG6161065.1 tyrosine--tRNA ligase [Leptospira bandrabouensis]MCG6164811.1 tyrosine--tRNA ligase [Leptospira bandrabouensis]TGN07587.1 tyrosine--tRNA ligase [Leptospira bandrabouensis]